MFGGAMMFPNASSPEWGKQLINTVATEALRRMFSASESLGVDVRCQSPAQLLQGSLDGFRMEGTGLVIRRQFRTASMWFETDAVAIDFGAAMQGRLALKNGTQAMAKVTLAESDLNQAFRAPLVTQHLVNRQEPALLEASGGQAVSFGGIQLTLNNNNSVRLSATVEAIGMEAIPVTLDATVEVVRRRRIVFANQKFVAEQTPEPLRDRAAVFAKVLGELLDGMVDLDRFGLDGLTLRLNRLETRDKALVFSGYAQIEYIPKINQQSVAA